MTSPVNASGLSKVEQQKAALTILDPLLADGPTTSLVFAETADLTHEKAIGLLNSLTVLDKIVLSEPKEIRLWSLTEEGYIYAKAGSPEARLFELVKTTPGLTLADVKAQDAELADVGMKNALKSRWLEIDDSTKTLLCKVSSIADVCQEALRSVLDVAGASNEGAIEEKVEERNGPEFVTKRLNELKKRKLCNVRRTKYYEVRKGPAFSLEVEELVTDLTQELIVSDRWRSMKLKAYNWSAAGVKPTRGSIHPLIRVMRKFKKVLISLQFEEMPTPHWIESSFWCFDALYQPQQHPARDAQDTFFLTEPEFANSDAHTSQNYLARVKEAHEKGGYGSVGYRYRWSEKEADKNIMRTHTTASSARMLYKMAQQYTKDGKITEKRLFSIDRVFRNETLDATHLAEFHQVEGVICGEQLSLSHLMGVMKAFYSRIGITDLRFKATYNPYTEPSMEIFGFHSLLNKWIEVGNSGVFRPEMLRPMGFGPEVTVMGWGLSLERPTMIRYNIKNIRDLFGHKAILGVN